MNNLKMRFIQAGILHEDGEPNEDVICEIALSVFCCLVEAIKNGMYSKEQVKHFFKECECSDDWRAFYFYLCGYYTIAGRMRPSIEWDIINDEFLFHVYRYYFIEMVDMLDDLIDA